jgi:hypothetical protein
MMHILKKNHNLLHCIMKLILRRGRIERDDSILAHPRVKYLDNVVVDAIALLMGFSGD